MIMDSENMTTREELFQLVNNFTTQVSSNSGIFSNKYACPVPIQQLESNEDSDYIWHCVIGSFFKTSTMQLTVLLG
jgi:hypothetical protein